MSKRNKYTTGEKICAALGTAAVAYGVYYGIKHYSTGTTGTATADNSAVTNAMKQTYDIAPDDMTKGKNNNEIFLDILNAGRVNGVTDSLEDFTSAYKGLILARAQETGILPEIVITQAIAESSDSNGNFGQGLTVKHGNNFFGIKAGSDWRGNTYVAQDSDGTPNQYFRAYNTPEESINDYFDWMTKNGYTAAVNAVGQSSASDQVDAIAARGYAASPQYSQFLKSILPQAKIVFDNSADTYNPAQGSPQANMGGYGGAVGVVVVLGLIGALVVSKRKKGIHGANDIMTWADKNRMTVAVGGGLIIALALGYYAGRPGNDQGGTQSLEPNAANLNDPTGAKYKIIAENLFGTMNTHPIAGDYNSVYNQLAPLNADELKAVVKAFGTRSGGVLGAPIDLFGWFDAQTVVPFLGWSTDQMIRLKLIFAPTGLWA